ncbi:MAG TPA: hypothetical protein VH280_01235 [Verrucomicrobiae bacterium]|nr:hypothetical protein [Verrucomicrobiae bacterium]
MKNHSCAFRGLIFSVLLIAPGILVAQTNLTLTGVSMFGATGPAGNWNGSYDFWDTVGGNQGWNVYLFTGSTNAPSFLNSGDDNDSLNPKLVLKPGTNTIHYAIDFQDSDPSTSCLGINLYFNNDRDTNRISAVVPVGGSDKFTVVSNTVSTYGQDNPIPGSGSLSYTAGGWKATLTDFRTSSDTPKLVSGTDTSPGSDSDYIGSFTLTVTPPEAGKQKTGHKKWKW